MASLICGIVGLLLVAALLTWAWVEQRKIDAAHRRVQIGDLWEHIGVESHPRRKTRGLYEVVAANVNTEAGPDSWVMRTRDGRTLYMHHNARVKPDSDWVLCMRDGSPMRRAKDVKRTIARGVHPAALFCAVILALSASGCSWLRGACADAVPVLSEGQAVLSDAALALQEAEDAVSKLTDPGAREQAQQAVATARAALRVAASTIALASTSCSSPTLPEVFRAFSEAWSAIRPFVALLGGSGTASVHDPLAYQIGAAR